MLKARSARTISSRADLNSCVSSSPLPSASMRSKLATMSWLLACKYLNILFTAAVPGSSAAGCRLAFFSSMRFLFA